MTTYLSVATRDRARSTYRAPRHLEGDKSWSDFVESAILAEVARRETAHNAGERYEGDRSPLPAWRPAGRLASQEAAGSVMVQNGTRPSPVTSL